MIVKTKLSDEEKKEIKELYNKSLDLKKNFPNYIHMDALNEKLWLFVDLFGEDFFKE